MITLLRSLAWWVLDRWPDVMEDRASAWSIIDRYPNIAEDRLRARRLLSERKPLEDEVDEAMRGAFVDAGVCLDDFQPETVLGPKLHEVLLHASRRLGNHLQTVSDVKALLK